MLVTPFGQINLYFDSTLIEYASHSIVPSGTFSDVDGCCLLEVEFVPDGKDHVLECVLEATYDDAFPETGEKLECMSFFKNGGKLSIGCEASFGNYPDYGYDFDGHLMANGIVIDLFANTRKRTFYFAVCWMEICSDDNEYQTWHGADPFNHRVYLM